MAASSCKASTTPSDSRCRVKDVSARRSSGVWMVGSWRSGSMRMVLPMAQTEPWKACRLLMAARLSQMARPVARMA